jgi:hypothetical protein
MNQDTTTKKDRTGGDNTKAEVMATPEVKGTDFRVLDGRAAVGETMGEEA